MKKVIIIFLVAVCAVMFSSCSNDNKKALAFADSTTMQKTDTPKLDSVEAVEAKNTAISKSKELPVGDTTFKKLVSYIEKHGFSIYNKRGHQFTFYDSRGNRHGFLAYPTDNEKEVTKIVVYAYEKGITDQNHFIPYDITSKKVSGTTLGIYGIWRGVEDDLLGYKEFLAKVNK